IEPAGPGHIGHHDVWIAPDEAPKMSGRQLSIHRIGAGGTKPDNDPNGLACVKFRGGRTVRDKRNARNAANDCPKPPSENPTFGRHCLPPRAVTGASVFAAP